MTSYCLLETLLSEWFAEDYSRTGVGDTLVCWLRWELWERLGKVFFLEVYIEPTWEGLRT